MSKKANQKLETEVTLSYNDNGLTVDVSNILVVDKSRFQADSIELEFSYEDVLNKTIEYLSCGKKEDGSLKIPDHSKEELKNILLGLDKLKEKIESYL